MLMLPCSFNVPPKKGGEEAALSILEVQMTTLSIENYSFCSGFVKTSSINLWNSYLYTSGKEI